MGACSVSELCAEGPSLDTPEIASLRLGCAHPCAQTVQRGALGAELADGTLVVGGECGVSAVVPQFALQRRAESAPNTRVQAA